MQHILKGGLAVAALALTVGMVQAQDLAPLNSDAEPDRMDWSELDAKFGPLPAPAAGTKVGGVSKTLTNEYWRSLGQGYQNVADKLGIEFVYQAAQSEGDQLGQLAIAENLIQPGLQRAAVLAADRRQLDPGDGSRDGCRHPGSERQRRGDPFGHPLCRQRAEGNGVNVANWFIENRPDGGKGRGDRGPAGCLCGRPAHGGLYRDHHRGGQVRGRCLGPRELEPGEEAFNAASTILQQYPDLIGFYANNDGMALGVVEAVKAAGKLDQVAVFGTDGISDLCRGAGG